MVQIDIGKPYFLGKSVEGMFMKPPVYDLVVGNIPGVRKAGDAIKGSFVMTRAIRASKPLKPLKVTQSDVLNVVNLKNLVQLQKDDKL